MSRESYYSLRYITCRGNKARLTEETSTLCNSTYREVEENQPDTAWEGTSGFVDAKRALLQLVCPEKILDEA